MIFSLTTIILSLIALCCFLAVKYHNTDKSLDRISKAAESLRPVTIDNVSEFLKGKGFSVGEIDSKEQGLTFSSDGINYHVDLSRRPFVFLHIGYGMEENADRECAKRAMLQTCDDIIMVKGNVYEDGYSFNIASSEQSIGNFSASFDRYLDILGDAIRHFGDLYHEYIGEKRGREQTLDSIQTGKMALDTTTAENKLLS